ncbi:MAG: M48 family metallopeptidase, partial [Prevotella sp.]|nr:M48 family metallopeptidase [Prevotella sp.]
VVKVIAMMSQIILTISETSCRYLCHCADACAMKEGNMLTLYGERIVKENDLEISVCILTDPDKMTTTLKVNGIGKAFLKMNEWNISEEKINSALEQNHNWLVKKYTIVQKNLSGYRNVADANAILVEGTERPLVLGHHPGIHPDRVEVSTLIPTWEIEDLYENMYGQRFMQLADRLADSLDRKPMSMKFRDLSSYFGYCNSRGEISFNYILLMLPQRFQECVICHELCHLYYMDHSANFHAMLDKIYPANREVNKELNKLSFLCGLYKGLFYEDNGFTFDSTDYGYYI